jgi:hypothetical protein
MKFKKTRIVISLIFTVLVLLLAALWVRSNSTCDIVFKLDSSNQVTTFGSNDGAVYFINTPMPPRRLPGTAVAPHGWKHSTSDANVRFKKFAWNISTGDSFVSAPHWFLMLICGIASTLPWIRRQFSLRMALVLLTITCCILGLVVWKMKTS